MPRRRLLLSSACALLGLLAPLCPAMAGAAEPAPAAPASPLTNLAHLDSLTTEVAPPTAAGHTTFGLDRDPKIGVLWVYANHLSTGGYQPTGGGKYDPAMNTYGQGAYDADDISRAAVVYLRQWRATGDTHSRDEAYQLLRGLTFLQTASGPNAGNVVLWMQPDGTLNPSPTPRDNPNPADSAASYWLARTVWSLGEGYAAFQHTDPAFADFLRTRLDLALGALNREVLIRYGQYQTVHGARVPAWLIVNGADATAEAVLGLSAYVETADPASPSAAIARTALSQFADGIAAMGAGDAQNWPYGAILPWALSRSDWHAWAAQMPSALAKASTVLGRPDVLRPAVADAAGFTPHLLTATGPDNGWLPTPADGSQIAYGADSRVQALFAVANAAKAPGLRQLAGVAAGWFFGQNPAGVPMYDPATGVTFDGVSAGGNVNHNSGAESTIHGLLSMQALDRAPDVAQLARESAHIAHRDGQQLLEAESANLTGDAHVVHPASSWTGESLWSGGAYVQTGPDSTLTWQLPAATQPRLVEPVADLIDGGAARTKFTASGTPVGQLGYGAIGAQGVAPAIGALLPVTLPKQVSEQATTVVGQTSGGAGQLDALVLQPVVSQLAMTGDGHAVALLNSVDHAPRTVTVALPGSGDATVRSYDSTGQLWRAQTAGGSQIPVEVPAGGFAILTR